MTASAAWRARPRQVDEYSLVRRLGDASDGVFIAHDTILDRPVVLSWLADPDPARLASVKVLARVTHPNLCPIHRARADGEVRYVVSSYARGVRLDRVAGLLDDDAVLRIGRGLAGALAALHAVGAAHGDVRGSRVALSQDGEALLFGVERSRTGADEEALRADVGDLLVLLESLAGSELRVRLRALRGSGGGVPDAGALVAALQSPASLEPVPGELPLRPYRGLRPFETADAALFFGRERETAELVARLRGEALVLVSGRSGVGKSSLAQAGLGPAVAAGALGERRAWDVVTMVPGASPLRNLAATLAPLLARDPQELRGALQQTPGLAAGLLQGRTARGLLLIVDQLEEALTLAGEDERRGFCEVVSCFRMLAPGLRVVLTLRSDFLPRLHELGPLGQDLLGAMVLVPPMTPEGLREAILAPARACGFRFESAAMVDALVSEASADAGALPLLSFALSELWAERDDERGVVPEGALRRLGGAAGALAAHGDRVLAPLTPSARGEARRILVALATASRTRARVAEKDLLDGDRPRARAALEALVSGRLVVAADTYEIAHEALLRLWPRLRAWLDEDAAGRAATVRLVAAKQAATRASRRRRWRAWLGASLGLLAVVGVIAGALQWTEHRSRRRFIEARVDEAEAAARDARLLDAQLEAMRTAAFARYDANDDDAAESMWSHALVLARLASDWYADASAALDLALARDASDPVARAHAADLADRWLALAERDREPELARDLRARLAVLDDDGSRRARLDAPARLRVTTSPPGARVSLSRIRVTEGGRRTPVDTRAIEVETPLVLEPGSYLLEASAPGRFTTRAPLLLGRGSDDHAEIALPLASTVAPGFVYVPAGVTLIGTAEVDGVRRAFFALPEHPVHVDAFLVGEHEVTNDEYLEFLAALPAAERGVRRPDAAGWRIAFDAAGEPALTVDPVTVRRGEPLCLPERSAHRCRSWLALPVAGVTREDGAAYARWLSTTRVPGARLCTEHEWERAARGADDRLFPYGDEMRAGEANFDQTYGGDFARMGADEVGSYPLDVSVFGVLDLGGNVSEWVAGERDATGHEPRVARGGFWYAAASYAGVPHRFANAPPRGNAIGLRVCASFAP